MMTEDELRAKYRVGWKIVQRERKMRERVFAVGHPEREQKLGEMDRLLEVLTAMKDELKDRMEREGFQPRLLDVPRRASYG